MNKELSSIVTLIVFSMALVFLMSNGVIAADSDSDGLENPSDNCIRVPNGPILGTCTAGDSRGAFCASNGECGTGGFCSMGQEDADFDGMGDACDYCAGDGGYDMDEDGYCDGEDNCPWVNNPDQNAEVCTGGIQMFTKFDTFEGTWSEIGRQIGHAYPDNIIDFANVFTIVLEVMGPPGWTPQSYYDAIEDLIPQSVKDHMQGMAVGLTEARPLTYQRAWDTVLVGNMAIELLNMSESTGCTAFAVSSEAGTFLSHNTDATKMAGNYSVAMYWKPTNGDYSYITMDPPAWVNVSFGLNEKGIGITLNAGSPNVNAAVGHPINLMVRYVMEHASSLDEAVSYFQDYIDTPGNSYGTSGTILLLVDFKDSSMAKIQQRSEVIDVTYGEELKPGVTYVYGTNHFLGDFNPDPEYYSESSFERLARLLEIMPQFDTYDLQTCLDILSDTSGGEASSNTISMDGGDGFGAGATQFSTVFTGENVYYTLQRPHEYLATYPGPVVLNYCGDGDDLQLDADADGAVDCCDNCPEPADSNPAQEDADCDGVGDICDSCPSTYNPNQEDNYPPEGNDRGDACECEGDFDCDQDQDGTDAALFKADFGRSGFNNPCYNEIQCHGDFDCDNDCDGTDAALFKQDFGRSSFNNSCPACVVGVWCSDYFSSSGCGSDNEFITGERAIMSNDIERVYYLKLPENYDSNTSYPLIFAFHGLGGDYTTWTEGYYDLQEVVGDEAILVYPNALLINNVPQWDYDTDPSFFDDLYAELEAYLCFDIRKVFAVGHSNGAGMSHTLGCKRGNILRAIGPVAGNLTSYEDLIGQVAVIQIHGSNDNIFPVESVKPTRDFWIAINGCNEGETDEGMDPTCEAYGSCDSGFPVQYCEHSGGHEWPDFASSAIWGFFQNLPAAVPSDETGSGDIDDLGNGTISFKIHYPSDFVGTPYKLALALYPYDSTQPFTGSPLYFLNLDISVGDYIFGEVTEYDNVEISLLGVEYGDYTLAAVVYIEGSSYPMPSDGIDYIGLQNFTLVSDTLEVTTPFELELVEW